MKLSFHNRAHKNIATLGFVGYLPYAPGTYGSAVAALLVFLLRPTDVALLLLIPVLFAVGVVSSSSAERLLGKDSGHIVIDEMFGYFVSVLFIPRSNTYYLLAAFILFRLFDIFKPPPVRQVEKVVSGGAGVMLDDFLAGIYTNLCIQIWLYLL